MKLECPTCQAQWEQSRVAKWWLILFLSIAVICRIVDHYWPPQTVTVKVCP